MIDLGPLQSTQVAPSHLAALRDALGLLRGAPHELWWKQLDRALAAGHDDWCRAPELARVGHALLEPGRPERLRIWACQWLAHFPGLETIHRLGDVLADAGTPVALREQAAWTLSYRQLQTCDDALELAPALERAADDVLLAAWERGDYRQLPLLVSGARHSRDERLLGRLAEASIPIEIAAQALEAFATPRPRAPLPGRAGASARPGSRARHPAGRGHPGRRGRRAPAGLRRGRQHRRPGRGAVPARSRWRPTPRASRCDASSAG